MLAPTTGEDNYHTTLYQLTSCQTDIVRCDSKKIHFANT